MSGLQIKMSKSSLKPYLNHWGMKHTCAPQALKIMFGSDDHYIYQDPGLTEYMSLVVEKES